MSEREGLARATEQPLVVFGDASLSYDFGPGHPLTPRRFPPAIDLLRGMGAQRFIAPEPATDEQLRRLHSARYIDAVRAFGDNPWRPPSMGIGAGDCPPFERMHEASAAVAGGSIAAVDWIEAGDARHAFHPGGGLHHAMAEQASGFCIYNDVALAVARARDDGHRVFYVDLDVHHGDGTQAMFWNDPQVLTFSIHETGLSLFPGTGFPDELGGPDAEGTAVNVPLAPYSGDASWIPIVEDALPALAAAFRPTFIISQHGCDSHAYDPLAHLRLTTRAYRAATTLLDELAHRFADGRWLATGGGGYDVYRVVPRSWALVWLAQAHGAPEEGIGEAWRGRWSAEADRFGQSPLPTSLLDAEGWVAADPGDLVAANRRTADQALSSSLMRLEAVT
ncbi:MAG: acetoin utilization protein AcuC [Chloroflexota bacterium]|nr:acetoin utilization protein AcuC [Chloroflexota bacterium]